MHTLGLRIWLVLAKSMPLLAGPKVYYLVNEAKTWHDAQIHCREKFKDLASIESAEDEEKVKNMIQQSSLSKVWIGLYYDVNSWRWSIDNTYLGNNHNLPINFQNLSPYDNCAYISENFEILDGNCMDLHLPLCYNATSQVYAIGQNLKTWIDARNFCRNRQSDLATVRDDKEKQEIMSMISPELDPEAGSGMAQAEMDGSGAPAATVASFSSSVPPPPLAGWWIGLFRDGWRWSDQSKSSFKGWAMSDPPIGTESCACATFSNWYDIDCLMPYPFICSVPIVTQRVFKVVLKTKGSVDLNDPMVKAAITEHVDKQVRSQGIPQEVQLRWREQPHEHVFNKTKGEL